MMKQNAETDPDWNRVEPLRGPSAYHYFVSGMTCVVLVVGLVGLYIVVQFATRAGFSEVLPNVMLAAIFTLVPMSYLFAHITIKRTANERAAGYSTSVVGWTDLPQIDRATGLIIRPAGHPLLDFEEKKVQAERVKAYKRMSSTEQRATR